MTVSVMRAIGPIAVNSLYSLSVGKDYMGGYLVYYVMTIIVCLSVAVASMLPQKMWS
jgi:hypothetical protein